MAQYSRATLTDAGVVIARRMMDDDSLHLTFTGIASGDGQYSTGEDLAAKTALKSQKQFFPLSSKKVTSDQVVQLKYVLSNINPDGTPLTVGYYVREVGIFAQVGLEAAVLYAIAVADENTADYMPEYNELQPSTITMDWFLTVANTENISIAASTTAYALASDLAETNDEVATKLTAQGGDASGTIITTVTASTAEYPVPAAGDSMSTIVGKIVKFFGDIVKTFTGATSSAAGKKGLVPAPSAGQQTAYMRGDGSWAQPQNNATTTQNGYVLDAKMGKTLQDQITSLNDSLALTRNYVREVTLTGTNLNLSNATAFLHVPVKFRYAIVLCRFVTYDGQGRFFAVACYTNYINTNTITVLDKSPALGEIDFQIGSSDGLPVLLVSVPGYGNTVLQSCEMTLLIRGLQN